MIWSNYQLAIFDFLRNSNDNFLINAVAGSGKSTVLEECNRRLPKSIIDDNAFETPYTVINSAFNVHIKDALRKRLPFYREVATFNSISWGVYRGNVRNVQLEERKNYNKLRKMIKDDKLFFPVQGTICRMMGLFKHLNFSSFPEDWVRICDTYGLETGEFDSVSLANELWDWSINELNIADYDDQIYQVIRQGWPVKRRDVAMIDEAQDQSPVQTALTMLIGDRKIYCGDECQPTGTMIDVVTRKATSSESVIIRKKPIEELKKYDMIVSMNIRSRHWNRSRPILGISSQPYSGDLIVVKTETGLQSKYTPNHKCIANFTNLRYKYCLYLMRKDNRFRIGYCRMDYGPNIIGGGLISRMTAEGADAAWILSVHDFKIEAYLQEQIIGSNFGIPQLMFTTKNNSTCLQEDLDFAWNQINNNTDRAIKCLMAYGRRIEYPLFIRKTRDWKTSLLRPMIVHACNLMDDCLVLPYTLGETEPTYYDSHHLAVKKEDYIPIKVSKEYYEGLIWSLKVAEDETYVADGILTHNSQAVYIFRGSDLKAIENIVALNDCKVLPLSVCYRCPKEVVRFAQEYVPRIEWAEGAEEGFVEDIKEGDFWKKVEDDAYVLCRTTAPLVSKCLKAIRNRRRAFVRGRDLGKNVLSLIHKIARTDNIGEFLKEVHDYKTEQVERLNVSGREMEAIAVSDRCETIVALSEQCDYVSDFEKVIGEIFSDNNEEGIEFSTIHKAKGREKDYVYRLRSDLCPHPKTPEHLLGIERNLKYVEITRSKKYLGTITNVQSD